MTYVAQALRDLENNVAPYSTGAPADLGTYDGQLHFEHVVISGYRSGKNIWQWVAASSEWVCFPCAMVLSNGDPNGSVTPEAHGQALLAQDTGNLYGSTGRTNNDWELTN